MNDTRLRRSRRLRGIRRTIPETSSKSGIATTLRKTISSDQLQLRGLGSNDFQPYSSRGSVASNSSTEKKNDTESPSEVLAKKKKYFSERSSNKNIFKKLIHPSYQERAEQYRRLFGAKTGPEPDEFLASFSCAYQREILCQGRMYISQRHICFYANIFGWETNLVLPVADVAAITKEKAALIFPNSLQIEMVDESRHFFASFVNREKTLTVLLKVSEKIEMDEVMSPEELWEYMKNTDDQDKGRRRRSAKAKATRLSMQLTEPNTPNETPLISRPADEFPSIAEVSSRSSLEQEDVSCPCESHEGKLLLDNVFPLSVDEIYDLLFTDCPWFQRFNDLLKNTEYYKTFEKISGYIASPWTTDKDGIRMRTCTYTMALNHAMAPKSCVVTEKQVISHFGRSGDGFIVNKESQNSGIPYANDFVIQCTYCISKITDNEARIKVHGGIIYKKSIWSVVRSYLEKGTYQGLSDHYSALESTLHKECQSRMTRPENEMIASRYDDDSLSSIEDPITDVKPNRVQARKRSRIRETVPLTSTVNATTNTTSTDYAFYIRIIICLLTGLLLLNILMLYRMKHLEMQPTFGEDIVQLLKKVVDQHKVADQTVSLENLLETVNQLTNDLQALKQQVSTKQDL